MTVSEVIEDRKVSRHEFARLLGIRPSTVYRWVNGETMPSGEQVVALEKISHGKFSIAAQMKLHERFKATAKRRAA